VRSSEPRFRDRAPRPGRPASGPRSRRATRDLWFRTGDLGRRDEDGFHFFVDRRKHTIRRRGENISSWELERILDKHPAVAECCAVAVPSPLGEDDVKVVVARVPGHELEPAALREWCTTRMAAFMLPRYVEVVDALPRSAVGKVAKHQLGGTGEGVWDAEEAERHAGVR
jgi:crotonobetaine/carnitine-CoA ligase